MTAMKHDLLFYQVKYILFGAAWTPAYELRVDSMTDSMSCIYYGLVLQFTCEDWEGATSRRVSLHDSFLSSMNRRTLEMEDGGCDEAVLLSRVDAMHGDRASHVIATKNSPPLSSIIFVPIGLLFFRPLPPPSPSRERLFFVSFLFDLCLRRFEVLL